MPTNRFSTYMWVPAAEEVPVERWPVYWVIDPAKPDSDRTVEWSSVNDVMTWVPDEPAAVAAPDTDRIWDMLVLAARSSRYGD